MKFVQAKGWMKVYTGNKKTPQVDLTVEIVIKSAWSKQE